jgi:hypothetical protein
MGEFKNGAYYPLGCAESMSEGDYQTAYADYDGDGDAVDDGIEYGSACSGPACLFEKPGYWRTRDRRVLKISEMETSHLRNAIHFFAEWREHLKILELQTEIAGRNR